MAPEGAASRAGQQADPAEQAADGEQRQADDAGEVRAVEALEQGDAGVLDAEAAGAVERLVVGDVALGLGAAERAQGQRLAVDGLARDAGRGVEQDHAGDEVEDVPGHAHELLDRAFAGLGLVQQISRGQHRDLIGAEDPPVRVARPQAAGLRVGQKQREAVGAEVREAVVLRPLVDARSRRHERDVELREQLVPITRGRGEHQRACHRPLAITPLPRRRQREVADLRPVDAAPDTSSRRPATRAPPANVVRSRPARGGHRKDFTG